MLITTESAATALFLVLFAMAMGWFGLIWLLYRRLEEYHPEKYEAMGSPTLRDNDAETTFQLLGFIVGREYLQLEEDGFLRRLGDGMLYYLIVYLALFLYLLASLFSGIHR
ncbi:MAG: hypothetical protein FIB05_06135 [Betaproteobacteria bacterium]|nr:hypothetical protein [Betaproteobacteria bacterium]PWB57169.1 MAG: hypothetical protein C3F16_16060 [Betaproteobacteria bacterium]